MVVNSAKKQFITMPTAGSSIFNLGALHPLTAMAWFKTTRQEDNFLPILAKIDPATLTGWAIGLDNSAVVAMDRRAASSRLSSLWPGTPTLLVDAPPVKNDGGWHLVAATYDGSGSANGVNLYIDGLSVTNPVSASGLSRQRFDPQLGPSDHRRR